jgi:uncharacterized protein
MRLSEVTFQDARPIDGYGPGFFRVGGEVAQGAIVLTATALKGWDGYDDIDSLTALAAEVDVLLIGTGEQMTPIPPALRTACESVGIGVEFMGTPAACRTFNVLMSEGRRVAAALLPV